MNNYIKNNKLYEKNIGKNIFFFIVSIILTFFLFAKTYSQSTDEIKVDINDTKNDIEKIDEEIKIEQDRLSQIQDQKVELEKNIQLLEQSQEEITGSIILTENNIAKITNEIQELRSLIIKKNEEIEQKKSLIVENLKVVNETQQISPILIFLSSERFSDFLNSFVFINRVNSILAEQTTNVIEQKETLEKLKAREEENKEVLVSYRSDLDQQKKKLEEAELEKEVLLAQVEASETEKEKIIAEKKIAKKQFEQQLFELESRLPKIDTTKTVTKASAGQFIRPVVGGWISARFGRESEFHVRIYGGHGHNGVDFAVPTGTNLMSVADGVVTDTGDSTKVCSGVQYGKWILIEHSNGVSSMYAHLSHIGVTKGQTVKKGQSIGRTGNTGYSTGAHLHLGMYATEGVQVKTIAHSFAGTCYGKLMKLPIAPHSAYLDPFEYVPEN